jgi:predicted DNA-binding protein (MmcQ/YjbR family)
MTAILMAAVFMTSSVAAKALTDEEVENLVKRSYQYVAMARRGV